jgi:transcriptional regulator with XRE-family HTH domain
MNIPGRDKMIEKLLEQLKQYMLDNDLTQKELAELLQVNQPQISRLFSGTRQPSAKMIKKIEQLLQEEKNDY